MLESKKSKLEQNGQQFFLTVWIAVFLTGWHLVVGEWLACMGRACQTESSGPGTCNIDLVPSD